ncbi:YihY/virulence factor BrkB family protein [Mariniluteicoccus endophyticus]
MTTEGTAEKKSDAPAPDDPRKPSSPDDLHPTSWRFTGKKALNEFTKDQCTDLAAGLTYYSVLALFPGLVAVVSLLGVVGQADQTTTAMLDLIRGIAPGEAADQLRAPIEQMAQSKGSGLGLVIGVLGAVWSASGYVGAFGRAMNRIYEIDEGRPVWKLKPVQLLITLACVLLVALVLVGLVVSGPIADQVGRMLGLGSFGLTVFNVVKWPLILAIVVALVALLYYWTPNVRQPRFRWVSVGSLLAIGIWVVLSVAFGFYVANFGNYNKTYGALGGVIIFLLWIWITNNALLFGAEVDSEMERSRELQAGIEAERSLQLPPRDTRASDKAADKREKLVAQGREIREEAEARGEDDFDRPADATRDDGE